jgi:hypothetical protein
MTVVFSDELLEFMESGVSTLIGTRSRELLPECARGCGAVVGTDRHSLTVFVAEALAQRTLANLADNGEIAITFSRPVDHRTLQVKGKVIEVRPVTPAEQIVQERYLASFVEQLYWIGMPRSLTRRLHHTPAVALTLQARSLFVQTPGPTAGQKLESSS